MSDGPNVIAPVKADPMADLRDGFAVLAKADPIADVTAFVKALEASIGGIADPVLVVPRALKPHADAYFANGGTLYGYRPRVIASTPVEHHGVR